MSFEWDETKNRINRQKHGISFEEACLIFDGSVFSAKDERLDYGEEPDHQHRRYRVAGHRRRRSHG
ncbi:unnamed protein product [Ciceribacter sp. T2.26MG-112.2]|uniref:BrnT family toxin n=1 Tax=Ciceribacter sp. T2.26MG-112.2 TaxID=3137154 RepID=UPI000E175D57|nr:BrnT family toxin [Ciceribacter naphthalenivorans]SSC72583.1 unnamed protein product [Ciceribacter naphthalenivorans]